MAITPSARVQDQTNYPTRDGRPMGETDVHRNRMVDLVQVICDLFGADPMTYVSGNLLIFYEPGNRRKHVAPDVFVVRGVPMRERDNYLVWEEGRAPDLVIELTSRTTSQEDRDKKFALYRDVLRVSEYFLFDPKAEYLVPRLQGYRLIGGQYVAIEPVAGRLASAILGLELEAVGSELRLYDPATGRYLPTDREAKQALRQAEAARQHAEAARQQAEAALQESEAARQQEAARRQQAETEIERLRRELEELRRRQDRGEK